jgi:hypothetical protein
MTYVSANQKAVSLNVRRYIAVMRTEMEALQRSMLASPRWGGAR